MMYFQIMVAMSSSALSFGCLSLGIMGVGMAVKERTFEAFKDTLFGAITAIALSGIAAFIGGWMLKVLA